MYEAKDVVSFLRHRLGPWDHYDASDNRNSFQYRWHLTPHRWLIVWVYLGSPGGEVDDVEIGATRVGATVNHTTSAYWSTGFDELLAEVEKEDWKMGNPKLEVLEGALRELCTAVTPEYWISAALGAPTSENDNAGVTRMDWVMPDWGCVWLEKRKGRKDFAPWDYEFGIRWREAESLVSMTASVQGSSVQELGELLRARCFAQVEADWVGGMESVLDTLGAVLDGDHD